MGYQQPVAPSAGDELLNNFAGTAAPTANDDSGDGYAVGSRWVDTTNDEAYICLDASVGAAVWVKSSANLASEVTNTPAGNIAATDVQAAINELDTDKQATGNYFVKGTDDADDVPDGTTNKAYTATEKTKLAGIETAADVTDAGNVGSAISGATAKTTPVDADSAPIIDSEAASALKKITWANIKAAIYAAFTTLTAELNLGENFGLALDAALSADGKYSGIVEAGTAGAALAFGDLCYLDPTDSRWELADANAAAGADGDARGRLGICVLAAGADGNSTKVLVWGKVRADAAFPALTVNNPVYVSETAGDITGTQPTTTDAVIRIIGFANTADELFFCPSNDYITHT